MLCSGLGHLRRPQVLMYQLFLYQSHKTPKWIRLLWTKISQMQNNRVAFGSSRAGELPRLLVPLLNIPTESTPGDRTQGAGACGRLHALACVWGGVVGRGGRRNSERQAFPILLLPPHPQQPQKLELPPGPGAGALGNFQQQPSDTCSPSLLPRPRLAAAEASSPCYLSVCRGQGLRGRALLGGSVGLGDSPLPTPAHFYTKLLALPEKPRFKRQSKQ